ncbi:MAG: ribosome-associated translation inhibitor RaiA [Oleispira antarctica]|uniref:Ribosome hibernation promoting factor n=1 Tax=Oleispira antarctica RB-8 TaxID=698738 RepID=R4YNC5_OLEAN|nr:ribosome-associated translation inhibitor RaiA [Oleispira antarctica]MBQ0791097.1 ribosome-associated translation inhibitor RaiA [Oleispira antarctica]CCK74618.1 probable Sigma 54 modulation protein/ribosomal protein S30EA [Oleispira antarctica RB-8]|tara:strand:+ start:1577 stop:1879 length:303 start_codon:yes stop_codon:yes gene_type:complete
MQINISGHHIELTTALKDYAEEKIKRLEHHFDQITRSDITLTVEKTRHKAECNMHVSGSDLHASAEDDDMYAAIDSLSDKLDRQLLKHKEKLVARNKGQG